MELVETRNQTENANETQSLREALKKLIEKNPDGGEVSLNEFAKMVPNASRTDCVRVLKKAQSGVFITGRRGRTSRFVYGPPAAPFMTRTVSVKHKPAPAPKHSEPKETTTATEGGEGMSSIVELKIGIGDQITTIPIRIMLSVAA